VYLPKNKAVTYPILLRRTPYSVAPYGEGEFPSPAHSPPEELAEAGYIFVLQDARGRWRSQGAFMEYTPTRERRPDKATVDESTDMYDTVEWLLRNVPNNNGRVGIYGLSYDGFYAAASITDTHPAVKAADIEAMGDWNYHHGAFMLADNFEFYIDFRPGQQSQTSFDYWTPDSYQFFLQSGPLAQLTSLYFDKNPNPLWTDQLQHNTYDQYWKERDFIAHLRRLHCAVLNVGGWLDQYVPRGPIEFHQAIIRNNPRSPSTLVMGPWSHGGSLSNNSRMLGGIDFGSDTAAYYRRKIQLPFFEYYLKNKGNKPATAVHAFQTGANIWRQYSSWPPRDSAKRTIYFGDKGTLSLEPPTASAGFDEYVSDPAKPVPFMGERTASSVGLTPREYMVADQRFAGRRPDVLVYQTEPLEEDLTVVGPISSKLFVSTSGTDSDWIVKVIDVDPDGYQQLVRGEGIRGKFRKGWDHPVPFVPGRSEPIELQLADVNHTFRRAHRIMVQVQSSWFPLMDLNPQKFMNIPDARREDFHSESQRLYRSQSQPSNVELRTLH